MQMFPNNVKAALWFAKRRWGNEPTCPQCGRANAIVGAKHPIMPYRCRFKTCRNFFASALER